jgi:hypothetical protein
LQANFNFNLCLMELVGVRPPAAELEGEDDRLLDEASLAAATPVPDFWWTVFWRCSWLWIPGCLDALALGVVGGGSFLLLQQNYFATRRSHSGTVVRCDMLECKVPRLPQTRSAIVTN